jgi:hypothetical protein
VRWISNWEKKSKAALAWFLYARSRVPRIVVQLESPTFFRVSHVGSFRIIIFAITQSNHIKNHTFLTLIISPVGSKSS